MATTRANKAAAVADAIGGKGGEAFLVIGVVLLGWLFVTRRLQGVLAVIARPADELPADALPAAGAAPAAPRPADPHGGGFYTVPRKGRPPVLPPADPAPDALGLARLRCGQTWAAAYLKARKTYDDRDSQIIADRTCGIDVK